MAMTPEQPSAKPKTVEPIIMSPSLLIPISFSVSFRSLMKCAAGAAITLPALITGARADASRRPQNPMPPPHLEEDPEEEAGIDGMRVEPLFRTGGLGQTVASSVTFRPGVLTAWHSHPLGETLVIIAGTSLLQRWGGAVEELHRGDTAWIAPGERHWHGAAAFSSATHLSLVDVPADGITEEPVRMACGE
jgi:quercetin dioxygenase-like cupin family protein